MHPVEIEAEKAGQKLNTVTCKKAETLYFHESVPFNLDEHHQITIGVKCDDFTPVMLLGDKSWRAIKDGELPTGYLIQKKVLDAAKRYYKVRTALVLAGNVKAISYTE